MRASVCNETNVTRGARKILCFAILAIVLAGCGSFSNPFEEKKVGPPPEPNILPPNYRANLLKFLEKELVDPVGVHGAYITEPALMSVGTENRYVICVRYDAKNGYGQYTGVRDYTAIYFHGELTQYVPANAGQCSKAAYLRFPELEVLKKQGT